MKMLLKIKLFSKCPLEFAKLKSFYKYFIKALVYVFYLNGYL